MDAKKRLKEMLKDQETYFVPGIFDCIGAIAAEKSGFEAALVSGNAVSASFAGLPDMGLLTMSEVTEVSGRIARSVRIPVIADADTGYGQPLNFMRTIQEFERGGVAGVHIEDQISPKKCAYYGGEHEVVSTEEYLNKLKAGLAARVSDDFCIIARTDALISYGMDEAVKRANLYLEAGADACFVVGCKTLEDIKEVAARVNGPVIVNINDESPLNQYSYEVFHEIGVKMVLYPAVLRNLFLRQAVDTLSVLKKNGNTKEKLDSMATLAEFQEATHLKEFQDTEYRYATEKGDIK